ncbi:MAG: DEAD/DEAH box helicase [Bacillota bacterium]|nr:DEAD/DEAH box helicase [Bacillota bacterium]
MRDVILHATWIPSGASDAFGEEEGRCGTGSAPRFDGRFFIWGESPERVHAKPRITRPGERRRRYARHSFLATRDELELALATLLEAAAGMYDLPSTRAATMLALLPSRDGRPEPSPLLLREVFVLPGEEGFSRPQNGGFEAQGVVASGLPPAEHAAGNGQATGTGGKQGGAEEAAAGADSTADDAQTQAGVGPSGRRSVGLYRVTGVSLSAADALSILAVVPEDGDFRPGTSATRIALGPDFRFWVKAAKLALELLARQRLVPCVVPVSEGGDQGKDPAGRAETGRQAASRGRSKAGGGAVVRRTGTRAGAAVRVVDSCADTARAKARAGWRPALDLPADAIRVRELAQSMPGICRAFVAPERLVQAQQTATSDCQPQAADEGMAEAAAAARVLSSGYALLQGFLDSTIDEAARRWLFRERRRRTGDFLDSGDLWLAEVAMKGGVYSHPAMAWLYALGERRPFIERPAGELGKLRDTIEQWLNEISAGGAPSAFRTCFRLLPPGEESATATNPGALSSASPPAASSIETTEANGETTEADGDVWIVEYLLQAIDDPSLVVPAARVWREKGRVLEFLGRRFENPQERLLADLGRASRLFPAVEDSLKTARPEACYLTTAEAYSFLREVAPLLEEGGFGVLVPPWWGENRGKAARLGIHLKVRAPASASASPGAGAPGNSYFGMDSLVEYDWQIALGDQVMDKDEFRRLVALKVPLVRVRGEWVEIRPEDVEAAIKFWDRRRKAGVLTVGEALATALQAGSGEESGLPVVRVDAEGWIGDLIGRLSAGEKIQELPQPRGFAGSLRPYQVRGYSWLSFLKEWGIGACLADDMGLGKTIQVIALVLRAKEEGTLSGPVLLVCPTSVVGNWCREIGRFGPSLKVMVHHGADRLSGHAFAAEASTCDVVITTYSLVHRDEEHLARIEWHGIVLDEAQNIKNSGTRQSRSVRRLKAGFRMALTGTPIENRLSELWSIMDFLNPGYLGPAAEFRRRFAIPIERYRDRDRAERLRRLVGPFILRRLKTDPRVIQDLPEKEEVKVYCTLTREQATLYEAVVSDMLQTIEGASGIERRGAILAALLKLKQVCNHPAQFLRDRSALDGRSGKLARLVEMLDEVVAGGNRALVFSQFAEMGAMLRDYLRGALGREVAFLHGGVPQKARDEMVQRFQNDPDGPPVFVLSLKAGGFGLNLTRANYVFHFDRWWNPAVENQATDRAFRIGQTQKVQVYKFICAGTLEERIDEMIEDKKHLADNVIGTGEDWITEMSTDELRDLFLLRREAVADDD